MNKSIPVDPDDPVKPPVKRKMKPRDSLFRLRDPMTGLFWCSSSAERPLFNNTGRSWTTRSSAMSNWGEYNYQRVKNIDGFPLVLELVTYKVVTTQVSASSLDSPDMERIGSFVRLNGYGRARVYDELVEWIKYCTKKGYDFNYVIEIKGSNLEELVPSNIRCYMTCRSVSTFGASNDPEYGYIAVGTETDMVYLRVALSEVIVALWDINSGRKLLGEKT
jgi:hypothetical protein